MCCLHFSTTPEGQSLIVGTKAVLLLGPYQLYYISKACLRLNAERPYLAADADHEFPWLSTRMSNCVSVILLGFVFVDVSL